jgi:hypothetical protein
MKRAVKPARIVTESIKHPLSGLSNELTENSALIAKNPPI